MGREESGFFIKLIHDKYLINSFLLRKKFPAFIKEFDEISRIYKKKIGQVKDGDAEGC